MQKYQNHFSTRKTPQTQPLSTAKTPQVKMRSGGHGWEVDDWAKLDRFLVLGTEGGTYYASERELTVEAAKAVQKCIRTNGLKTVQRIVEISQAGRAPKNDPALFALAMCAKLGDEATRAVAYKALPKVARIGTHLFHFMEYVKAFGGLGGNGLKRALSRWYNDMEAQRLCLQMVKYQQRDGWSHRDVLRLAHPDPVTREHNILFNWAVNGWVLDEDGNGEPNEKMTGGKNESINLMLAFELAKRAESVKEVVRLIEKYRLPHECVPTQFKNEAAVWEALLPNMPVFALMRNLNKLTAVGLITNTSTTARFVYNVLIDQSRLVKARVHPLSALIALKTYAQGHGFKGKLTWQPVGKVIDALDKAFYLAFKAVEPTGKRLCLGLDVSGSMCHPVNGQPFLSCREAAAAMALVTANVEDAYEFVGFTSGGPGYLAMRNTGGWGSSGLTQLKITPRMRLDDVVQYTARLPFGGTDCALPVLWALANKIEIDAFVTYTDNESWAGEVHVDQALKMYRDKTGIPAKLVAVAMAANHYSVANPDDAGQLDCVGFDTATPQVISDFIVE